MRPRQKQGLDIQIGFVKDSFTKTTCEKTFYSTKTKIKTRLSEKRQS